MHGWDEKINFTWKSSIITSGQKDAYLRACGIYSGLPTIIPPNKIFHINGKLIHDDLDFYYLVAETLIGDKGYFGSGYDSFSDCLIESYNKNDPNHNYKIIFNNTSNIKNALTEDYFEEIVNLLKQYNFQVEIIE